MWPTLNHSSDQTLEPLSWQNSKVPLATNLEGHSCGQIMTSHCDQTCDFVRPSYGQILAPLLRSTREVTLAISVQTPLHIQIGGHSTLAQLLRPNSGATLRG